MEAKNVDKRMDYLKQFFSKKIIDTFADGIQDDCFGNKNISYEEAVEILNHTISEVGKNAVLL